MNRSEGQPDSDSLARAPFSDVVRGILHGPWEFIQLRGTSLRDYLNTGAWLLEEDVDLLGAEESIMRLIQAAHEWCQQGQIHFSVERRRHRKIRLILYSLDACQQIAFDLWTAIPQLPKIRGRAVGENLGNRLLQADGCLRFEDCQHLISDPATSKHHRESIIRLPVIEEFCLYVCHLDAKRKDLNSDSVSARLSDYRVKLSEAGAEEFAKVAEKLLHARKLDAATVLSCASYLYRSLSDAGSGEKTSPVRKETLRSWLLYRWMQPPRDARFVFVTGCDGTGKTAVCQQMKHDSPDVYEVMTGKHLYRKSLFYKALVILVRPLLFQDRERFDETLSSLAYLLGATRLSIKSVLAKLFQPRGRVVLIDRSLLDILIVGRKSDKPRLSAAAGLRNLFGLRYPVVHLHVPTSTVLKRKQEMSPESQQIWNELVFHTLTGTGPVRYIGLNNSGELSSAATVLNLILNGKTW